MIAQEYLSEFRDLVDEYQQLFIENEEAQQHEVGGGNPVEQLNLFAKEALGIYLDTVQHEAAKEGVLAAACLETYLRSAPDAC